MGKSKNKNRNKSKASAAPLDPPPGLPSAPPGDGVAGEDPHAPSVAAPVAPADGAGADAEGGADADGGEGVGGERGAPDVQAAPGAPPASRSVTDGNDARATPSSGGPVGDDAPGALSREVPAGDDAPDALPSDGPGEEGGGEGGEEEAGGGDPREDSHDERLGEGVERLAPSPPPEEDEALLDAKQEEDGQDKDKGSVAGFWGGFGGFTKSLTSMASDAVKAATKELESLATEPSQAPAAPPAAVATSNNEEVTRESVLKKLGGEDTVFDQGLKAVDEQVDRFAASAASFFGRLVSTAAAAGKEVSETFHDGMEDLKELHAVKAASNVAVGVAGAAGKAATEVKAAAGTVASTSRHVGEMGMGLAKQGTGALENVGTAAMGIVSQPPADPATVPEDVQPGAEEASFTHGFYIYGGADAMEELEALANDRTLACNRTRVGLPAERKARIEADLKLLEVLLDLGDEDLADDEDIDADVPGAGEGPKYAAIRALRMASVGKVADMAGEVAAGSDADGALDRMKDEVVQRLSELCSMCLQELLRAGQALEAGGSSKAKGVELRGQARRMVADIEAMCTSHMESLGSAAEGAGLHSKGATLQEEVFSDGSVAANKIGEGLQSLLYVILHTSLED